MSLSTPTRMVRRPTPQLGTQRDVLEQRAVALAVDAVVVGVLVAAVGFALGGGLLLAGVAPLVAFAYVVSLEGTFGQTVGKRLLDLTVVTTRGYPCSYRASAVRTLVGVADALPCCFLVGLASIRLSKRGQRLGDVAADTVVVRSTRRGARLF